MPFKLQNNRMIEVKHETVFGRCVEVSGISFQGVMQNPFWRSVARIQELKCEFCGLSRQDIRCECYDGRRGCGPDDELE